MKLVILCLEAGLNSITEKKEKDPFGLNAYARQLATIK